MAPARRFVPLQDAQKHLSLSASAILNLLDKEIEGLGLWLLFLRLGWLLRAGWLDNSFVHVRAFLFVTVDHDTSRLKD